MTWVDSLLDSRRAFFSLLAGYFLLQLILRLSLPDSLDLDEAEQVFQSQWWLLGYGPQPPLYNWLQQGFMVLFGTSVLALGLFKNLLLMGTWSLVYLVAQRTLNSNRLAALVTLSLVFIPQISWESQRDLSHSVLVTTLAILTFYQGLRLLEKPDLANYLILGLVVGLGCNAKYSYLLFAASLFFAVLSMPELRKRLLHPALFASAILALAICLPHWWWLVGNLNLASESTLAKLMRPENQSFFSLRWEGLVSLFSASLQFLALFAVVFAAFFLRANKAASDKGSLEELLVRRYLLVLGLLFLVFILLTGVNFIKDRWMQPLLLLVPLAVVPVWAWQRSSAQRGYAATALVFMVLIPVLLGLRIIAVDSTGRPERMNLPFSVLIAEAFPEHGPDLVLTERVRTAGNIRLQLPDARVLTAERMDLGHWVANMEEEVWMIWNATGLDEIPTDLADAISRLQPDMRIAGIRYLDIPYHYSEAMQASFGLALLVPEDN